MIDKESGRFHFVGNYNYITAWRIKEAYELTTDQLLSCMFGNIRWRVSYHWPNLFLVIKWESKFTWQEARIKKLENELDMSTLDDGGTDFFKLLKDHILNSLPGIISEISSSPKFTLEKFLKSMKSRFTILIDDLFGEPPPKNTRAAYFLNGLDGFIDSLYYDHNYSHDGYCVPIGDNNRASLIRITDEIFFDDLFIDSLLLNVHDCIIYFYKHRIPFRHEIKGLTKEFVEEVREDYKKSLQEKPALDGTVKSSAIDNLSPETDAATENAINNSDSELTTEEDIIKAIENVLKNADLAQQDRTSLKAVILKLKGKNFTQIFQELKPNSDDKDPSNHSKGGHKLCEAGYKLALNLGIKFKHGFLFDKKGNNLK